MMELVVSLTIKEFRFIRSDGKLQTTTLIKYLSLLKFKKINYLNWIKKIYKYPEKKLIFSDIVK